VKKSWVSVKECSFEIKNSLRLYYIFLPFSIEVMQMVSEVRLILKKIVENILVLMKNIYINSKSGRVKQINENKC
jgi:hypothetical protein